MSRLIVIRIRVALLLEIFLPGGLFGSGPGEACDKDSGRHRNDLVGEQTWKNKENQTQAHI